MQTAIHKFITTVGFIAKVEGVTRPTSTSVLYSVMTRYQKPIILSPERTIPALPAVRMDPKALRAVCAVPLTHIYMMRYI